MSGGPEARVVAGVGGAVLVVPLPEGVVAQVAALVAQQLGERRRWAEVEGVADYLGVPVSRVRYLRERGLPAKKIGKRLLFDLREVDAWLEAR